METVTQEQGAVLGRETVDDQPCQHHWLIEAPSGPFSKGVCRVCGEERQFQNYVEGHSWSSDISLEQLAGGARYPSSVRAGVKEDSNGLDEDS